jgi:hypothetical protein
MDTPEKMSEEKVRRMVMLFARALAGEKAEMEEGEIPYR